MEFPRENKKKIKGAQKWVLRNSNIQKPGYNNQKNQNQSFLSSYYVLLKSLLILTYVLIIITLGVKWYFSILQVRKLEYMEDIWPGKGLTHTAIKW